ncbi:MAG: tetratricopeptide repeat protein [Planctomycetaceae bacterium]
MSLRFFSRAVAVTGSLLLCAGCGLLPGSRQTALDSGSRPHLDQSTDRSRAVASLQLAEQFAAKGNDGLAIEQYLRVREYQPGRDGIAHPLAVLYDRQGRVDSAEREYRLALDEAPKDADLLNDYGYFLYSQGDLSGAEELYHRALKQNPQHRSAQVNLALAAAEQQRYEEAFILFERAVGPAAAHHNVGVVLARHGKLKEAEQHLLAAAKRDPSLELTQDVLAWIDNSSTQDPDIVLTSHEAGVTRMIDRAD